MHIQTWKEEVWHQMIVAYIVNAERHFYHEASFPCSGLHTSKPAHSHNGLPLLSQTFSRLHNIFCGEQQTAGSRKKKYRDIICSLVELFFPRRWGADLGTIRGSIPPRPIESRCPRYVKGRSLFIYVRGTFNLIGNTNLNIDLFEF